MAVLTITYQEMLKTGAILGALRSRFILPLIADSFQERDWRSQSADELVRLLNRCWGGIDFGPEESEPVATVLKAHSDLPLWKAIIYRQTEAALDLQRQLPWAFLGDREFQALAHWNFTTALYWGFQHPAETLEAANKELARTSAVLPNALRAGLQMPADWSPPSIKQLFAQAEELVGSFQNRVRPLVQVPPELRIHPAFDGAP